MFNLIKLTNKQNSIYLENEIGEQYGKSGEYKISGIEINNKIFIFNNFYKLENTKYVKNKKVVFFEEYMRNLIKSKLKEQLRLYVAKNINNYDLYKRNDITKIIENLNTDTISNTYISVSNYRLDRIRENKIVIDSHGICYIYDLEKNILDVIREGENTSILHALLYQRVLDYAVAKEQYKRGIAPNIVYELKKIDEFVKGKYKIKVILNDDSCYTIKNYSQVFKNISSLFSYYENSDLEIFKRNIVENQDKDINIRDIKALKYGQVILPINQENLEYEVEYKIKKKVA